MERDYINIFKVLPLCHISTHTLTWSVTMLTITSVNWLIFQLTRSRGAWLFCLLSLAGKITFQLTRSRGAWLLKNSNLQTVTTFQLTRSRGAWQAVYLYDEWILCISTHTLTWSVTANLKELSMWVNISTHTLTWSVTYKFVSFRYDKENFNSHAHVERD